MKKKIDYTLPNKQIEKLLKTLQKKGIKAELCKKISFMK